MQPIVIENLNNKLNCDVFCHITRAPEVMVPESLLPVCTIVMDSNTKKEYRCELVTYLGPFTGGFIPSVCSLVSHGMSGKDLFYELQKKNGWNVDTKLMAYYYKKID